MGLEFRRPSSLEQASLGGGAVAVAGGTEVTPLMRSGLLDAHTLVDVRQLVPRGVDDGAGAGDGIGAGDGAGAGDGIGAGDGAGAGDGTVVIGAGTTLAELERSGRIPEALREACRLAASPQIRHAGTIAGNLLQSTRCWYWRLGSGCWLQGGDTCHARDGRSDEHAVFGHEHCGSAHPSDPAAALLALGATVRTDRRLLPIDQLYRSPSEGHRTVVALEPGELITELSVPPVEASSYLKAMDRRRYSFPIVGVAAARAGGAVRIAVAGMAPVPWLLGSPGDALVAIETATPMAGSAFKVDVAHALVERAVQELDMTYTDAR